MNAVHFIKPNEVKTYKLGGISNPGTTGYSARRRYEIEQTAMVRSKDSGTLVLIENGIETANCRYRSGELVFEVNR